MPEHTKTNDCDNCGDSIVARRPSKSGKHFCSRPPCQAARQRWHRQNRPSVLAAERAAAELESAKQALLAVVVGEQFLTDGCPECGQAPAYEGWVHPTPGWGKVCNGSGIGGNIPELSPYYKIIWPTGCPF